MKLESIGLASIGQTFRGQIWDNCARFKLTGPAYASMPPEQNGHFKIETARHLEGPLRALLDPNVREVAIVGATQVLKSVCGDVWVPFVMEHMPRSMLVLFEDDPKAKLFCDARLMPTIKNHPVISRIIEGIDGDDATKTEIRLASMMLKCGGLNDGNVSSLSWEFIWMSEVWQHRSDGLLKKAKARADRFRFTKKILIESQAGYVGEDWDRHVQQSHVVPLTWACPMCGGRQSWDFSRIRSDDFIETEKAKRGTYSGMTFSKDDTLTIQERARTATWECYHCGGQIEDKKANRLAIAETYQQDYHITTKSGLRIAPESVTFILPKESAWDNSLAASSASFLTAKEAEREGNKIPIANWYMSERATFYGTSLIQVSAKIMTAPADVVIENEHHRGFIIDCQKDAVTDNVGTFWWEVYAADTFGNCFQLDRGFATSWGELDEVQARWKIQNSCVSIDGRYWTPEVQKQVAARKKLERGMQFGRVVDYWATWTILLGDSPAVQYRHPDGNYRAWSPPTPVPVPIINAAGKREVVTVFMYRWSNLSIKDQLAAILAGGEGKPKMVALPREKLSPMMRAKEIQDLAYDRQMNAEVRGEKNGKPYWEQLRKSNHFRDTACMKVVQMGRKGLAGHQISVEQTN